MSVTITTLNTPVLSGQPVQWSINYQCSSVDPSVTTCDASKILVALTAVSPMGNPVLVKPGGSTGDPNFTPAPDGSGFVAVGSGSLSVGSTGNLILQATPKAGWTPDGSTINATATFTASNAASATATAATEVVVNAAPDISVVKKLVGPSSVRDQPTTYSIGIQGTPAVNAWTSSSNPQVDQVVHPDGSWLLAQSSSVIKDVLPTGAVFVSASNGGSYDALTNTVTWTGASNVTVTVIYPSATFAITDVVTNNSSIEGTTVTDPHVITAASPVTHGFGEPQPGAIYNKTASPNDTGARAILVTSPFHWIHTVRNTGNVPIGGTIYDYPPCPIAPLGVPNGPNACTDPGFTIDSFTLSAPGDFTGMVFELYMADGTVQTVVGTPLWPTGTVTTAQMGVLGGSLIAGYKITLQDDLVPVGKNITLLADGHVTDPATYTSLTMTNCGNYLMNGGAAPPVIPGHCPAAYFTSGRVLISTSKSNTSVGGNNVLPGDMVPWQVASTNLGVVSDPLYLDADHNYIADVLPTQLTYVPGSESVSLAINGGGTVQIPVPPVTVTQNGQNLTFTFPPDFVLPKKYIVRVDFKTIVNPGVPAGTYSNCATAWTAVVDPPSSGGERCASFTTGVAATASSQKQVQGDYDAQFMFSTTGYAAVGTSPANGSSKWRINIGALGNTAISGLIIYDVFPKPGDTGVSAGQVGVPRESKFRPYLTGPLVLPAGVTATYSTAADPCRPELIPTGPAGCVADWTASPADWTAVTAVRIDASSKVYQPGQVETVEYSMQLPADAVPGDIAWNSLAYAANRADTGAALLPAEPVKVGIKVAPPPPAIDLSIAKTRTSASPAPVGSTVTFLLVPHNNGPNDAVAGWSVTDVLPTGLTLVSMTGTGYQCSGATCTADAGLAAGADGGPILVSATIDAGVTGVLHNVTYVSPAGNEITETNPLVVPSTGTNTDSTATNNDAQADVEVGVAPTPTPTPTGSPTPSPTLTPTPTPSPSSPELLPNTGPTPMSTVALPYTGASVRGSLNWAVGLVFGGALVLLGARRRALR